MPLVPSDPKVSQASALTVHKRERGRIGLGQESEKHTPGNR